METIREENDKNPEIIVEPVSDPARPQTQNPDSPKRINSTMLKKQSTLISSNAFSEDYITETDPSPHPRVKTAPKDEGLWEYLSGLDPSEELSL